MRTAIIAAALAVACGHAYAQDKQDVTLRNGVPGATVTLVRMPEDVKDIETALRLWSENEPALAEALVKMPDADAAFVAARLEELSSAGPERVRELARQLAKRVTAAPESARVVGRAIVDINGTARLASVPSGALHLIATRPLSADFLAVGVKAGAAIDAAAPAPGGGAGSRVAVRSSGGTVKITIGGKLVAEVATKAGETIELDSPSAELAVSSSEARARVGTVQLVHRSYGVFVKLEPGASIEAGETIAIYREGKEVGRAQVLRLVGSDTRYPDGAAQVSRDAMEILRGDEVRRVKP